MPDLEVRFPLISFVVSVSNTEARGLCPGLQTAASGGVGPGARPCFQGRPAQDLVTRQRALSPRSPPETHLWEDLVGGVLRNKQNVGGRVTEARTEHASHVHAGSVGAA